MVGGHDGKFKIGMHSCTLHLSGFGESWRFQKYGKHHVSGQVVTFKNLVGIAVEVGFNVLHVVLMDTQDDTSDAHLAKCHKVAEEAGIRLELNASFNAPSDPRVSCDAEDSLYVTRKLGCNLIKYSTDVEYPEKSSHPCLTPSVMKQLVEIYGRSEKDLPLTEKCGMKIVTENHCGLFADGAIWLVKQLSHPLASAYCDTVNSLMVMEEIAEYVRKMAPYYYCVHFCDNGTFADPDGTHSFDTTIRAGNTDCRTIMDILREGTPDSLDTIDLEIELPLSGYSTGEGREMELKGLRESAEYMCKELGIGRNPAKVYGPNSYFLNK